MSEPITERLSRFTPSPMGLDRDALLFNAGRRSARPNGRWKTLVGGLVLSQCLTLALLGSRPATLSRPSPETPPSPVASRPETAPSPGPSTLIVLRRRFATGKTDLPPLPTTYSLAPGDPPLRASPIDVESILD